VPASNIKELTWICDICQEVSVERKIVYEPSDRLRIINRLQRLGEDYDFIKMSVCSQPDQILVRIKVPDFDPSELRAIQTKQLETGFIRVDELILLQRAGFRRPTVLPPKPG